MSKRSKRRGKQAQARTALAAQGAINPPRYPIASTFNRALAMELSPPYSCQSDDQFWLFNYLIGRGEPCRLVGNILNGYSPFDPALHRLVQELKNQEKAA